MRLMAIARNTFREAVRHKVFYLLIFFGMFFAFSSRFVSMLSVGDHKKVLMDVGLASIHFFSVLVAIFTGINLVYKEIEKKTIYNILSKPITRGEFVLGKFTGLALTLLAALGSMAVMFFLFLFVSTGSFEPRCLVFFALLYIELLVITALSLVFSSFSTPILSSIFTITIYLVGSVLWTFQEFKTRLHEPFSRYVATGLYYLLPNLDKFNIKNEIVLQTPLPAARVLAAAAYGLVYVAALLTLAVVIFRRRELN